jgi:hypothetical protein
VSERIGRDGKRRIRSPRPKRGLKEVDFITNVQAAALPCLLKLISDFNRVLHIRRKSCFS